MVPRERSRRETRYRPNALGEHRAPSLKKQRLKSATALYYADSASREPRAILPGKRLGPYEILPAIGAGGMGEVYKAEDIKLPR